MAEITPLHPKTPIVDANGVPTIQFVSWMTLVNRLAPLSGTGTPESSVEAPKHRFYWDETANVLYFKELTDIGGDASQGWIAV